MIARWLSASVVLLGSFALAAEPASQPARSAPGGVMVFPFGGLGDTGRYGWIGQAMQTNLASELGRLRGAIPQAPERVPADLDAAIRTARAGTAQFAISGTFQAIDDNLRVTGQVVDVATGQIIGSIKATGSVRDLFLVEDTVADQAKRAIQSRTNAAEVVAAPAPTSVPPSEVAAAMNRPYPWDIEPDYSADRQALADRYRYGYVPQYAYGPFPYGWGWDYNGSSGLGAVVIFNGTATTTTGTRFAPTPQTRVLLGDNTPGPIQGGNFMGATPGGNFMGATPGGNFLQPVNVRTSPNTNRR